MQQAPATSSNHNPRIPLAWVPPQRQEFRALSPEAQANEKGQATSPTSCSLSWSAKRSILLANHWYQAKSRLATAPKMWQKPWLRLRPTLLYIGICLHSAHSHSLVYRCLWCMNLRKLFMSGRISSGIVKTKNSPPKCLSQVVTRIIPRQRALP